MSLWSRFLDLLSGRSPTAPPVPTRHRRREAARQRHQETGEPMWTEDDRHLGPIGEHAVADVAPGTPGHFGSVRSAPDE